MLPTCPYHAHELKSQASCGSVRSSAQPNHHHFVHPDRPKPLGIYANIKPSSHSSQTMRLINTSTGVVETFLGRNIPQYAILSHTWEDEEVSSADITQPSCNKSLKGFAKIEGTCKLAWTEGFQYAWVDTCCIDKTSSSELSEAINYMHRWYQRSATCYVYLSDLNSDSLAFLRRGLELPRFKKQSRAAAIDHYRHRLGCFASRNIPVIPLGWSANGLGCAPRKRRWLKIEHTHCSVYLD